MIPTVYMSRKGGEQIIFIVNIGHEEVQTSKGHTLVYLISVQYDNLSDVRENQESIIANISYATSETKVDMLLAIPTTSKMIFPGDHTSVREVLFQDAKIFVETQEKLV